MEPYNALKNINSALWLNLDEAVRLELIEDYVEGFEKEIDNSKKNIHASIHMVVENQLALGEEPALNAYSRLLRQGLNRHETIHAIGAVIFSGIYEAMQNKDNKPVTSYKSRLRKLTAKKWLKGKY